MTYALLKYSTTNLGDEIQSIAARQYLPRVDHYVLRDDLNRYTFPEPPKLIMNGWYTHRPENWPPDQNRYNALMTSFHISGEHGGSVEAMTSPAAIAYYKRHEPVGCRDYYTRDLLLSHGVDAFFSGCLTLTLQRDKSLPRTDTVLAVDVPGPILSRLVPSSAQRGVIKRRSAVYLHRMRRLMALGGMQRPINFHLAQGLLDAYASARFVITSRLHCALPCLAFGTPVLFLLPSGDDPRFAPLGDFANTLTYDAIENGGATIDLDRVAPNPGDTSEIVSALRAQVTAFINA